MCFCRSAGCGRPLLGARIYSFQNPTSSASIIHPRAGATPARSTAVSGAEVPGRTCRLACSPRPSTTVSRRGDAVGGGTVADGRDRLVWQIYRRAHDRGVGGVSIYSAGLCRGAGGVLIGVSGPDRLFVGTSANSTGYRPWSRRTWSHTHHTPGRGSPRGRRRRGRGGGRNAHPSCTDPSNI